jgi:hypothetical protein
MKAFAIDLHSDLSPTDIARRHPAVYPEANVLAERIRQLRQSGVRRYSPSTTTAQR